MKSRLTRRNRRVKTTKSRCSRRRVRKQRGGVVNFNSLSGVNKRKAVIAFLDGGDVDSVRTLMSLDNADILTADT
jgi:hypothetical protein